MKLIELTLSRGKAFLTTKSREHWVHLAWLIVTCLLSALYISRAILSRWIPHDEGTFAIVAELVERGLLPHLDFVDEYTGGHGYINALAFKIFGTKLAAMRLMMFSAFMSAIPFYFLICRRALTPFASFAVTFSAVVWSIPNLSAPMTSWYVLIFSIMGCFVLLKYLETQKLKWLFFFGLTAGLSFLIKVIGVYQLLGGIFFICFLSAGNPTVNEINVADKKISALISTGIVIAVLALVMPLLDLNIAIHFLLPCVAVYGIILLRYNSKATPDIAVQRSLINSAATISVGFILPIALAIIPYAMKSAWRELFEGIFVLPSRRLVSATYPLPSIYTLIAVIPIFLLFLMAAFDNKKFNLKLSFVLVLLAAVLTFGDNPTVYQWVWFTLRPMLTFLLLASFLAFYKNRNRESLELTNSQMQFAGIASICCLANLVQYPYPFGVYFYYFAPLLILAAVFFLKLCEFRYRWHFAVVLGFYSLFAAFWLNSSFVRTSGVAATPDDWTYFQQTPRGGLNVDQQSGRLYDELVKFIQDKNTGKNDYIYAGPDSPELYFLTGFKNPQKVAHDIFETDHRTSLERLKLHVEKFNLQMVVVNLRPEYSKPLDPDCITWLKERYSKFHQFAHFALFYNE